MRKSNSTRNISPCMWRMAMGVVLYFKTARVDACYLKSLSCVGRAFSAGHDLKQMRATPSKDYYRNLFAKVRYDAPRVRC